MVALAAPAAASPWHFSGVERVVAMSDIHGAYPAFVRTLRSAGIIDASSVWTGGKAHLVIVGDVLDRGPESRQAMDLLMRLEQQAAAAGGMVHVLIGNHEAMNLVSDLRYVSKAEYAAFEDEETDEERERWLQAYSRYRAPAGNGEADLRQRFDQSAPPGFFAHRRAFSAEGRYGRWLLDKPVMIVINETAYVHGGVSPMIADIGLEGVNGRLRGELVEYVGLLDTLYSAGALLPTDNFYDHPSILRQYTAPIDASENLLQAVGRAERLNRSDLHRSDGPLWYRGNVSCSVLVEADRLDATLASIGARRVVIGHTPTYGRRILERFGGTVIEVDTGMLNNYYRGSGNAVVIEGDSISVVNEAGTRTPDVEPHPRRVGQRPVPGLGAEDIENLLLHGDVLAQEKLEDGSEFVTLSDGDNRIQAVFTRRRAKNFYPAAAAYRLDLLLGLDMVPVAVRRKVGRAEGSLRFRVPGSIDEQERFQRNLGGGAQCPIEDQVSAMTIFDALIHNRGRTTQSIRYSPDTFQMLLVAHDLAFATSKGRPGHLEGKPLALTGRWYTALEALTDAVLAEHLGDVLDKKRIGALAARRDELLAQKRIMTD